MKHFFDTSALVKLYHHEAGTERVLPLYNSPETIVISEIGKVEMLSTLHKKLRIGEISGEVLEGVRNRFFEDCAGRFVVVHVAPFIMDAALELLSAHGRTNHLYALDALQIATFTTVADQDTAFVCADKRLATLLKSMEFRVMEL